MADSQLTRPYPKVQPGNRYGAFTVLEFLSRDLKHSFWKCVCDCGKEQVIRGDTLRNYIGRQCTHGRKNVRHNLSRTHEYRCWRSMIARCTNPSNDNYDWYGGIGHYVCQRWMDSVSAFVEDMGRAPSLKHTIDRINTHGSYTCGKCPECQEKQQPANCRWATKEVQVRNAKNNLWFTHDGKTLILKDWARYFGVNYHSLWQRIFYRGLSFEEAVRRCLDTSGGR